MAKDIIITGGGLCGALLALRLGQRGYKVQVIEKRPDIRSSRIQGGRSINLALSHRGIASLLRAGISEDVKSLVIPMHGRMIHNLGADPNFVKYSGRENEWINSISRGGLNALLIEKAEQTGNVTFHFSTEAVYADLEKGTLTVKEQTTEKLLSLVGEVIFGTDGANSIIRDSILSASSKYRFDFSINYLDTAYKELEIPQDDFGSFRIESNALHIWPRKGFMLIALPNLDKSFTVTLFLPYKGDVSFSTLKTNLDIEHFFQEYFPSATAHMPNLLNDFHANPTSSLATIKCYPWQVNSKFLLLGDAAHAIVPFYGQGMNASFEDVAILDKMIDIYDGDWNKILPLFEQERKIDTDAIADLALENQIEMRSATADPVFLKKRKIELLLEQSFPDYYSKYSLVTFRDDIPYHRAMIQGRKQDELLMQYAAKIDDLNQIDIKELRNSLENL